MSHEEIEPIPGLPEEPPEGERILWQGAPKWTALARRVFKARHITAYFGILVAWAVITALYDGRGIAAAMGQGAWLAGLGAAGIGLLGLYAWLIAKTTMYTITNRRIVFRVGVALPLSINVPFKQIHTARMTEHGDGTGNIAVRLKDQARVAYLHLWPHARPWRFKHSEPMLRCIPETEKAATILGDALADFVAQETTPRAPAEEPREPADQPAGGSVRAAAAR
jgi:hypothetical protein